MIRRSFWLALGLLLAACAPQPHSSFGPVQDTLRLDQNPMAYVQPGRAHRPMLPADAKGALRAELLRRFFAPWDAQGPIHPAEDVFHVLEAYADRTTWGENLRPHDSAWLAGLAANADPEGFPAANRKAVAVATTSMRLLPTNRPLFLNPNQAGEGFPFDYLQNSLLPAGTPVRVSHVSRDRVWLLAETEGLYGWIPARDAAFVDDSFERSYRTQRLWAPLADGEPVAGPDGLAGFTTRLGMLLPLVARDDEQAVVLFPRSGFDGRAVPVFGRLDAAAGAEAPPPLTQANLARAAAGLMGQPYGWGGMFNRRDCSATLQDLFLPFGVILPRNSRSQINAGSAADLSGLDREAKLAAIREHGRPWMTLLYKPGHILLYLGEHDGEPVALQTMWGVKTKTWGAEGRHVVGATVITTLTPGAELDRLAANAGLLDSLTALRVLDSVAPGKFPYQ